MESSRVRVLPGMRDVTGDTHRALGRAAESFRASLRDSGYVEIDTPLLEDAELFVRKSGGELASRLYTFTEPGGRRVSLRPEFTSSVIRHLIQESESVSLPVRWQYGGPVFRYETRDRASYRQFTQVGAELIGAGGVEADAEVLSLACAGLRQVGLSGFRLRIGHLGVLNDALSLYGLSDRAKLFVISNVRSLKNGVTDLGRLTQQAREVGLLGVGTDRSSDHGLDDIDTEGSREYIQAVLTEAMSSPVGRRTPEEIVGRLLRKIRQTDDPENLESAMRLVGDLAGVEGDPETALKRAAATLGRSGGKGSTLDELGALVALLNRGGVADSQIVLDFGLARGFAYYTGVIFELTGPDASGDASLCGGGRYDGLVRALGGDDLPAAGFAYNLDRVVDELRRDGPGAAPVSTTSTTE